MSISPISSQSSILSAQPKGVAADGDTVAVERAQLLAKQQAATLSGGSAPSATSASGGSATAGGVNKTA